MTLWVRDKSMVGPPGMELVPAHPIDAQPD